MLFNSSVSQTNPVSIEERSSFSTFFTMNSQDKDNQDDADFNLEDDFSDVNLDPDFDEFDTDFDEYDDYSSEDDEF